jgi:hypothetical protein
MCVSKVGNEEAETYWLRINIENSVCSFVVLNVVVLRQHKKCKYYGKKELTEPQIACRRWYLFADLNSEYFLLRKMS